MKTKVAVVIGDTVIHPYDIIYIGRIERLSKNTWKYVVCGNNREYIRKYVRNKNETMIMSGDISVPISLYRERKDAISLWDTFLYYKTPMNCILNSKFDDKLEIKYNKGN